MINHFDADINPVVMFPAKNSVEHCAVKINMRNLKPTLAATKKYGTAFTRNMHTARNFWMISLPNIMNSMTLC